MVLSDDRLDALEKMLDEREDRTKERFASMKVAVDAALSAADRAVTKAEDATNKRFEGVNEFRQTLADQAAMLMPRAEYTVQYNALVDRVMIVERRVGTVEDRGLGRASGLSVVGQWLLGGIAIVASMAAVITAVSLIWR